MSAGGDGPSRLSAKDIHVRFEGLRALAGVTLALLRGEILGLIGPNGAGKTTFINVLTGFERPTFGQLLIDDENVTGWQPRRLARKGVARTFQGVRLFRRMTVSENLEAAALATGIARRRARVRAREILAALQLDGYAEREAGALAYGLERLVAIGRALALAPKFLLLDEPAAGMNDAECDRIMHLIGDLPRQYGCGVLLIEHNMRVVMGICQRVQVIASGETVAIGTPEEIQRNRTVIDAYLG